METVENIIKLMCSDSLSDDSKRILFDTLDRLNKTIEVQNDDETSEEESDEPESDEPEPDSPELIKYKQKREMIIDAHFRLLNRAESDEDKKSGIEKVKTLIAEKLVENKKSFALVKMYDHLPISDQIWQMKLLNDQCQPGIDVSYESMDSGKLDYRITGKTNFNVLPKRIIDYICKTTPPIVILRRDPAFYYAFRSKIEARGSEKITCDHCQRAVRRDYMYMHLRKHHVDKIKTKDGHWIPCVYGDL